jgi:hypothetical protein
LHSLDCDLFSRPEDLLPALQKTRSANPFLAERFSAEVFLEYMVEEMKCAHKVDMMPALLALLRRKDISSQDLLLATTLFRLVLESDESHRATAGRMRGAEVLISLIQRGDVQEGVIMAACRALAELADETIRAEEVGAAGGAEVLLQLIRARWSSSDVVPMATYTLGNVIKVAKYRQVAVQEGAIELMVDVLQRPEASDKVLAVACRALAELAVGKANAQRAGKAGGVMAVISIFDNCEQKPFAAQQAIHALQALVINDKENAMDALIAIPALLKTMAVAQQDWEASTFQSGWVALCTMVQDDSFRMHREALALQLRQSTDPVAEESALSNWQELDVLCAKMSAKGFAEMPVCSSEWDH